MKILKIYQNFLLRNLIINTIVFGIIFVSVINESKSLNIGYLNLLTKICLGYFPCIICVTFFNLFIIKPFFFKKKFKVFIVLFVTYWVSFYFLMSWYFPIAGLEKFRIFPVISLVVNGIAFYFFHLVITKKITQSDKEIINFQSELSFLKLQLNPHFLPNAMNNLYGESLTDPDKLPERILNLSDMLRYQIEATKKDYVLIVDEINFLEKYIQYNTFRNERLEITQNYEGNFDKIEIPPLFFLPLVENAVKFSGETSNPFIILDLNLKGQNLSFSLKNNCLETDSKLSSTGIGIENLKRRLEVYSLKHELYFRKDKNTFSIKLNIWNLPTAVS